MMKRQATSGRAEGIRRMCYVGLALIVVSFVGSPAYALDPMGPPASDLRKGEYTGGIDVSLTLQDLEATQGTWTQYVDGALVGSGPATLGTLKNFEIWRAYATLGFSPIHSWEAFLRMGGTTGELGDEFWGQGEEFESGTELTIGGGIRKTFFEEMALKIGGLVQANWCEFDGKVNASHWAAPHFFEVSMLEVQAALGATYMFSSRMSIYGGPFVHLMYGDLDYVYSTADGDDLETWQFNWDIEEDITYGGYVGAQVMFSRDGSFNIEYQHTGSANAIGASVLWRL